MGDADDIIYGPIRKRRVTYEDFGLIPFLSSSVSCVVCAQVFNRRFLEQCKNNHDPEMLTSCSDDECPALQYVEGRP